MPSLAGQTVEQLGGPGSVLARQRRDHAELEKLLQRVEQVSGVEQDELVTEISRLVFPHAYAEEVVLWPAIRLELPDGHELTLRIEQEHQQINEAFKSLERTSAADPSRRSALQRVVDLLRQDVRDEEDVLLPRLQQAASSSLLLRLGRKWELMRRTAPTRPHDAVSRRPLGNALSGVPLAVIDRSRDRLDRAARRGSGKLAAGSAAASRVLGAAAQGVERLGPLRVGEHPTTRRTEPLG